MADTKHTPGPWHTNGYVSPMSGRATVYNRPFGLGDVAEVFSSADAHLIAAAPELLDALQAYVATDTEAHGSTSKAEAHNARLVAARAAITKATGADHA